MRFLVGFLFVLFISGVSQGQELLKASEPTEEQWELIKRGAELHDEGKLDKALDFYQRVLDQNEHCAAVIYEMAHTYMAKQDKGKARELAERGLRYDSPHRLLLHILLGSIEDDEGKPELGIEHFKKAIDIDPTYQYAYFNLAVTLMRVERNEEAMDNLKKSISLNPLHPSGHFHLASLYEANGHRIPALYAYTRYVCAGYDKLRTPMAIKSIGELIHPVNQEENVIYMNDDTSEGNFGAQELMLGLMGSLGGSLDSIVKAVGDSDEEGVARDSIRIFDVGSAGDDPYDKEVASVSRLFRFITQVDSIRTPVGFAEGHYLPFFRDLISAGHLNTLVHIMAGYKDLSRSQTWLGQHPEELRNLALWIRDYYIKE